MSIQQILDDCDTLEIFESFLVMNSKLTNPRYKNIMCSISGGADSDIVIDICRKIDTENKIKYVFFDTGLEYQATKEHLKYLENKYDIKIKVEKAIMPIPTCCRKYGQPFISKQVSEWISRLQRHNFQWEDESFETLLNKYPKCKAALKWWCNQYSKKKNGAESSYNIAYNKHLKDFMIAHPPTFLISNKCCYYAKKLVAKRYKTANNIDLSITGIRKSEGGARATAYKTCFTSGENDRVADEYRVIFWYNNEIKRSYESQYEICHSKCYTEYGLSRTGCAGCPYGRNFEQELDVIRKHEPKFYNAVNKIFGDSYEYTRKYKEFVKRTQKC